MGFRQRVRSFEFDGVLSGEDVERLFQDIGVAFDRHRSFLHRFEKSRLRLWRSTVDLVGKNDIRENWSFYKDPSTFAGGAIFFDNFRSRNIGRHQVRCELDTFEIEMKNLRHRGNQQRFGQTGYASDNGVAAGQQRDHYLINAVLLSDDDLSNLMIDSF